MDDEENAVAVRFVGKVDQYYGWPIGSAAEVFVETATGVGIFGWHQCAYMGPQRRM